MQSSAKLSALAAASLAAIAVASPAHADWTWPRHANHGFPSWATPTGITHSIYASPSGSDSNPGTLSLPVRNLSKALSLGRAIGAGTEIVLRAGDYLERGVDNAADWNCSAIAWCAVHSYPGERARIQDSHFWYNLAVKGQYWLIEGLEVDGSMYGTTTNNNVSITDWTSLYNWGTSVAHCNDVGGEDCTVGISVTPRADGNPAHHVIVRDNDVHENNGAGISFYHSDFGIAEDNLVRLNAFFDRYGGSGITFNGSENLGTPVSGYQQIIERNVLHRNALFVISTDAGDTAIHDGNGCIVDRMIDNSYTGWTGVLDNISYDNGGSGCHAFRSNNVEFVNNTFWGNGWGVTGGQQTFCNTGSGVAFYNNIAQSTGGTVRSDTSCSSVSSSHNIWYGGTVGSSGATDKIQDPLLTNPSATSYTFPDWLPGSTSPAVNYSDSAHYESFDINYKAITGTARDGGALER